MHGRYLNPHAQYQQAGLQGGSRFGGGSVNMNPGMNTGGVGQIFTDNFGNTFTIQNGTMVPIQASQPQQQNNIVTMPDGQHYIRQPDGTLVPLNRGVGGGNRSTQYQPEPGNPGRFGGSGRPAPNVSLQQFQSSDEQSRFSTPIQEREKKVTQPQPQAQAAPQEPPKARSKIIHTKNWEQAQRSRPFDEKEILIVDPAEINAFKTYEEMFQSFSERAYDGDTPMYEAVIARGYVTHIFHNLTVRTEFESKADQLPKVLSRLSDEVKTKQDVAFLSLFNSILTDLASDFVRIATSNPAVDIDSFIEDFRPLMRVIGDQDPDSTFYGGLTENDLLNFVESYLESMKELVLTIEENGEDKPKEKKPQNVTSLNEVVWMVYLDMLSVNIGDGPNGNPKTTGQLIKSLSKFVPNEVFYIYTLDQKVYKAIKMANGSVSLGVET